MFMVARVQKLQEGLGIVISEESLAERNIAVGSEVEFEIRRIEKSPSERTVSFLTSQQALDLYHETEREFESAYRDLAK